MCLSNCQTLDDLLLRLRQLNAFRLNTKNQDRINYYKRYDNRYHIINYAKNTNIPDRNSPSNKNNTNGNRNSTNNSNNRQSPTTCNEETIQQVDNMNQEQHKKNKNNTQSICKCNLTTANRRKYGKMIMEIPPAISIKTEQQPEMRPLKMDFVLYHNKCNI